MFPNREKAVPSYLSTFPTSSIIQVLLCCLCMVWRPSFSTTSLITNKRETIQPSINFQIKILAPPRGAKWMVRPAINQRLRVQTPEGVGIVSKNTVIENYADFQFALLDKKKQCKLTFFMRWHVKDHTAWERCFLTGWMSGWLCCRIWQSSAPGNVKKLSGSLTFVIEETNDRTSETETCVFHVLVI